MAPRLTRARRRAINAPMIEPTPRPPALSDLPDPSPDALWRALSALIDAIGRAVERDSVLDDCLDLLIELLGADRGLILLGGPGEAPAPIHARGHKRALGEAERLEISRTVIDDALRRGASTVVHPMAEAGAVASMAELGIFSALAGPLRPFSATEGDQPAPIGALYVDFRHIRQQVGEAHLRFFDTAAKVIASAIAQARRAGRAEAALAVERQRRATWEGPLPDLDELLRSSHLDRARREVHSALRSDAPILITGESGTGKTLLAQVIAEASGRAPVIRATLGSSDDLNTITSELFGHEKGAFSGAVGARKGVVTHADGGTLILDEILNLPPAAQQLLLDFTQFGTYRPLGYSGPHPRRARVRIIAATNGDLSGAMRAGRFRSDLYYRLAGVVLRMPPLRDRRGDISWLAESYLRRRDPTRGWTLTLGLRRLLTSPSIEWPGNIRQLEAVMGRARDRALVEDAEADRIDARHLDPFDLGLDSLEPEALAPLPAGRPLVHGFQIEADRLAETWQRLEAEHGALADLERRVIQVALAEHDGVVTRAARALGIPRTTLASRIGRLGLDRA